MGETKISKLALVQDASIISVAEATQLGVMSNTTYPVDAVCNSCYKHWCAISQDVLDRFMFKAPGGFESFVCPECRHLAGGHNG